MTAFLLYLVAVALLGSLLAWPLYLALAAAGLPGVGFAAVLHRTLEALAVLGLWPLLRVHGLRGRGAWGYAGPPRAFAVELGAGLALGAATLGVLGAALLLLGVRHWSPGAVWTPAGFARVLAGGLLSGLAVALVEETWFRGGMLSALRRAAGARPAVAITALLFGAVHFLAPAPPPAQALHWSSGPAAVLGGLRELASGGHGDALAALVAAGVLLGVMRLHHGGIARCIGMHAGWVVVIRLLREASDIDPAASWSGLVSGYDGVIGWLGAVWFGLLALAYHRLHGAPAAAAARPAARE